MSLKKAIERAMADVTSIGKDGSTVTFEDGVLTEKINNVRIASQFATSGSGTSTDPYIAGIENAFQDCIDEGEEQALVFVQGEHDMQDTVTLSGADLPYAFKLFGLGNQHSIITSPTGKTAFEIGTGTDLMRIPIVKGIRFNASGGGANPCWLVHGMAAEFQMYYCEISNAWRGIRFNMDNRVGYWFQLSHVWFYGATTTVDPVSIEIIDATQHLDNLWIDNCWFANRDANYEGIGISSINGALSSVKIQGCNFDPQDGSCLKSTVRQIRGTFQNNIIRGSTDTASAAKSRWIWFDGITYTHPEYYPFLISGNQGRWTSLAQPYYFAYLDGICDYIDITNNSFRGISWQASDPLHYDTSRMRHTDISHNTGI